MKEINSIIVSLEFTAGSFLEVGELILNERKVYFKYSPVFLSSGLDISPFKLKLTNEIQVCSEQHLGGLFGVFDDSLPDGWGKLLTDRSLIAQGIALHSISSLHRLAIVGSSGRGALTYKPVISSKNERQKIIDLDVLANSSLRVLEGEPEKKLDEIRMMGGSSGGARPKIQVLYNQNSNHILPDSFPPKNGYESWIIKFPNSTDFKDVAQIEYAYYLMAQDAGIEISESKLFTTRKGNHYFGTKRFDRYKKEKLHMISAAGLTHDNYRMGNLDYGHIMKAAFHLEKDIRAAEKVFRMAVFNVLTHNRDDHSKNFAFLMNEQGKWQFAPAYDLTFSNSSHGWHSTMVAGESQSPKRNDLLKLASTFDLRKAEEIIDHIEAVVMDWEKYALEAGVSKQNIKYISGELQKRRR